MWLRGSVDKEQLQTVGRVGSIGIEMGLALCLGYFGGQWLDGRLGTAPYLTFLGARLGLVAGLKSLYQLTRRTKAELEAQSPHQQNPKKDV
jgi:ATP synthase protein I